MNVSFESIFSGRAMIAPPADIRPTSAGQIPLIWSANPAKLCQEQSFRISIQSGDEILLLSEGVQLIYSLGGEFTNVSLVRIEMAEIVP